MRCKNCGWENPGNKAKCEKCNASLAVSTGEPDHSPSEKNQPKKTSRGCSECGYPVRDAELSCPRCGHSFGEAKQATPAVEEPKPAETPEPKPAEVPKPKLAETPEPAPAKAAEPIPVETSEPTPVPAPEPTPVKTSEPAPVEALAPTPVVCEPAVKTCVFCNASVPETARFCPDCGASYSKENKIMDTTLNPWVRAEQIQSPKCSLAFISGTDESTNDSPLRFSGNVILLHRGNTEPDNQTITSKTQAELCFENDKWYIQDKSALKTTYVYAGERKEIKPGDIIVLGNRSFVFNCVQANQVE